MSATPMRVVIVGSGLAGPCLAHALLRAGIDVRLYERDTAIASRGQGYRIHIDPMGDLALNRCLPEPLYQLVRRTAGVQRPGSGVTIFDAQLNELNHFTADLADPSGGHHLSVDRLVLRETLMNGLEDRARFGAAFVRYDDLPGGRVRAFFSDGTTADADVLVAADGSGSVARKQALPRAQVIDTGMVAIFGKTPLTDEVRALVPERSLAGFSTVVGTDGRFLPLAGMEYAEDPVEAAAELAPGLAFHDTRDYVMWVLGAPPDVAGRADRLPANGAALAALARELVADWHPAVGDLIARGDTDTVTSAPLRTSVRLDHLGSGPVTFVGDAIHCMIPSGIGAAVALRDAEVLADRRVSVQRGDAPLLTAIEQYERAMLEYGFAAVDASQRVGEQFAQT